jgi:hypothetical protein
MSDSTPTVSDTHNAFEALVATLVDPEARPHRPGKRTHLNPAQAEGVPPHGYPRPARRGPRRKDGPGERQPRGPRKAKGSQRPKRSGRPRRKGGGEPSAPRAKDPAD